MEAAVDAIAAEAITKLGGIHSIWLDGGADLVQSPSDEQEAFAFVRRLQSRAYRACVPGYRRLAPDPRRQRKKPRAFRKRTKSEGGDLADHQKRQQGFNRDDSMDATRSPTEASTPRASLESDEESRHTSVPSVERRQNVKRSR